MTLTWNWNLRQNRHTQTIAHRRGKNARPNEKQLQKQIQKVDVQKESAREMNNIERNRQWEKKRWANTQRSSRFKFKFIKFKKMNQKRQRKYEQFESLCLVVVLLPFNKKPNGWNEQSGVRLSAPPIQQQHVRELSHLLWFNNKWLNLLRPIWFHHFALNTSNNFVWLIFLTSHALSRSSAMLIFPCFYFIILFRIRLKWKK